MAYAAITGSVVNVELPQNASISIKAKTNSKVTQKVTINSENGELYTFEGAGERNTIIGQAEIRGDSKIQVKFEYLTDGKWFESKLNTGGPYNIGNYNLLVLVAENGDDNDYNDSILELNWYNK